MPRQALFIKDITPTTSRPWTVKVMVTEKGTPRKARASSIKYQHLVLTDSVGGQVQLGLFDTQIAMFQDRLKLMKEYYISNATVKEAKFNYKFGNTPYQWSLHGTCVIDEVEENLQGDVAHEYNFVKIDDVVNYKDSPSTVDILVVVLQMLPRKQVNTQTGPIPVQEFIVMDECMKPVIFTFWEQFINNEVADIISIVDQKPILAALRVKVTPYDGLTINTRFSSSFLINPTIPDALTLRTWLFDNMSAINELLNSKNFVSKARAFGKDTTDVLRTVSDVTTMLHLETPKPIESIVKSETASPVLIQLRVYYTTFSGIRTRRFNAAYLAAGPSNNPTSVIQQSVSVSPPVPFIEQPTIDTDDLDLSVEEQQLLQNILQRQTAKKHKALMALEKTDVNKSINNAAAFSELPNMGESSQAINPKDNNSEEAVCLRDDIDPVLIAKQSEEIKDNVHKNKEKGGSTATNADTCPQSIEDCDYNQELLIGREDDDFAFKHVAGEKSMKGIDKSVPAEVMKQEAANVVTNDDKSCPSKAKRKLHMMDA